MNWKYFIGAWKCIYFYQTIHKKIHKKMLIFQQMVCPRLLLAVLKVWLVELLVLEQKFLFLLNQPSLNSLPLHLQLFLLQKQTSSFLLPVLPTRQWRYSSLISTTRAMTFHSVALMRALGFRGAMQPQGITGRGIPVGESEIATSTFRIVIGVPNMGFAVLVATGGCTERSRWERMSALHWPTSISSASR